MSSPLDAPRFSELRLSNTDLRVVLLSCPGVRFSPGGSVADEMFLREDLNRLEACGVRMVLSCVQASELALGTTRYAREYDERGLSWHLVEIPDMSAPVLRNDIDLDRFFECVRAVFAAGDAIAIHCMGGLGRSGTVAARLAMRYGLTGDQAIAFIRDQHDPAAIETKSQEEYLLKHRPGQSVEIG